MAANWYTPSFDKNPLSEKIAAIYKRPEVAGLYKNSASPEIIRDALFSHLKNINPLLATELETESRVGILLEAVAKITNGNDNKFPGAANDAMKVIAA